VSQFDALLDQLEDAEALLLEPRATYDRALIGITEGIASSGVAVYDAAKCIQALAEDNDWPYDEALEWFNFNTSGAYVGEATPIFVNVLVPSAEE
jgi:hypothetical protein